MSIIPESCAADNPPSPPPNQAVNVNQTPTAQAAPSLRASGPLRRRDKGSVRLSVNLAGRAVLRGGNGLERAGRVRRVLDVVAEDLAAGQDALDAAAGSREVLLHSGEGVSRGTRTGAGVVGGTGRAGRASGAASSAEEGPDDGDVGQEGREAVGVLRQGRGGGGEGQRGGDESRAGESHVD